MCVWVFHSGHTLPSSQNDGEKQMQHWMEKAFCNNTTAVFKDMIYSLLIIHVPKQTLCSSLLKYPSVSIKIPSSHEPRNLVCCLLQDLPSGSSTQHLSIQYLTSFIPSPKPRVIIWTNSLTSLFSPFPNGHTALLSINNTKLLVLLSSHHAIPCTLSNYLCTSSSQPVVNQQHVNIYIANQNSVLHVQTVSSFLKWSVLECLQRWFSLPTG